MKKRRKSSRKAATKKKTDSSLMLILKFLLMFNILSIPMYMIMYFDASFTQLQDSVALLSNGIMKIFGYDNNLDGHSISLLDGDTLRTVDISWDSTGWKSMYAIFALVAATPLINFRKKLLYTTVLIPSVFLINLARVVTTITLSIDYGFSNFDLIHLFLWRYLLIGTILTGWLACLKVEKII